MKRIQWMLIGLLLVFFLSSCDLLNSEDVVELSEQFCKDNPDSEICQGSFIDNLEQQTIEQLFWDFYNQQDSQTDYCAEFISFSNTDFLDDCREGLQLYPEDIEDFDIVNLIEGSDTDKNTVTITLSKGTHSDLHTFDIILVNLDDEIRIESWNYDTTEPDPELLYETMIDEMNAATDATAFCTDWFTTQNVSSCVAMVQDLIDNDYVFTVEEYTILSGDDQAKLITNEVIPRHHEFLVDIVKEDQIYRYSQQLMTAVYDDYTPVLEQFILGLNSVSLTDNEVCGVYLEGTSFDDCAQKREQIINDVETVAMSSFEWTNESTKSFTVGLTYTGSDYSYTDNVDGSFYLDGTSIQIDMNLPYDLSRLLRTAMLSQLVSDMNDDTIPIGTVVEDIGDGDTEAMIVAIREYMVQEELEIESYDIRFGSTTFEFTLDNGDRYEYDVIFEYDSGIWYMSFHRQFYLDEITWLDKRLLLERYVNAFNTGMASDDVICATFFTEPKQADCIALRSELWDADQYLRLVDVDISISPNTVQFAVENEAGDDTIFYLNYDLDFDVVDNHLLLDFTNEERLFPISYDDSLVFFTDVVYDLQDSSVSAEDFCDDYDTIFDDCLTLLSDVRADDLLAAWTYLEETDEEGYYDFSIRFYHMTILWRELEIEVTVMEDLEENSIIMGRSVSDILVPPDEGYQTRFEEFLTAYFDDTMSDQDIYDEFFNGMEFEGLYKRDYILTQGITYVIHDITWHADMGFVWYEADVTFTRSDDVSTDHIIRFELYPAYEDDLNLKLFFGIEMPEESVVNNFATSYINALSDTAMDQAVFCDHFFPDQDYDQCIAFTTQLIDGPYTPSINLVTRDDHYASLLIDFTAPDLTVSQLLFELQPIHDIKGTVYFKTDLQHPDTELRNRLSTYVIDGLIYGFNTHGINLPTFCDEFAVCGTAFDDITSTVHHLQYVEVAWTFDDFFDPELQAKIEFNYYDGVIETHRYSATYVIDDDYYVWTLHFIQKVPLIT